MTDYQWPDGTVNQGVDVIVVLDQTVQEIRGWM